MGTELVSDEPLALDVGAVSEGGVGTGAVVGFGAALVVALELGVPGVVLVEVVLEVVLAVSRAVVRLDPVVVVVVPIRAIVPVVDVTTGSRLPARVVDVAVVLVVELVATGTEVSASKSF